MSEKGSKKETGFETILVPTVAGLYCPAGDFYIDPTRKVPRAIITHGHSDHARKGHGAVLATRATLAFMAMRYGKNFAGASQTVKEGETLSLGDAKVTLLAAGHMLGSVQVYIEHRGISAIVSGDFKRSSDPTCPSFDVRPCDLFVTEATFALPLYRHPPPESEIEKLLLSLHLFADRPHLVHAYSIGKAQRVIALLRQAGYDETVRVHKAIAEASVIYEDEGIALGPLETLDADLSDPHALDGKVILSPPGGATEALEFPVTSFASGWMRLKSAAKSRGGDLPLILSDHADWDELVATVRDVGAKTLWITHGREDVLAAHVKQTLGVDAMALSSIPRAAERVRP